MKKGENVKEKRRKGKEKEKMLKGKINAKHRRIKAKRARQESKNDLFRRGVYHFWKGGNKYCFGAKIQNPGHKIIFLKNLPVHVQ